MTLLAPLPPWHDPDTGSFVFLAPGLLLFAIPVAKIMGNVAVSADGGTDHPYAVHTSVQNLSGKEARDQLARLVPFEAGALARSLALWENFCEAVVDQLEAGKPLAEALQVWKLDDATVVNLEAE